MSVDKTPTGVVYTVTNGAVGQQYPLTFPYINGADVKAYYVLNGTQTVLTYGVHYAVSSQTFTASIALPLGAKLAIYRQTDLTQEILWKDGQSVYTPDIMKADDKLTLIAQEIAADMSRTVKLTREEEAAGGKPEEVVQAIYASRDAAAASASTASAQATAAQYSADMAAHSAEMAAQTVQTATADVVTAATTQANAAQNAAAAAAQSALDAAAAVPDTMVERVTATETKNTQQDTRLDAVESKNTQQDTRLTSAETGLAGKMNVDGSNVDLSKANVVLQRQSVINGEMATGSTLIPADDTIPQSNEGDQFMSITFTTKSASSKIDVDVVAYVSSNDTVGIWGALFLDSATSAFAVGVVHMGSQGPVNPFVINTTIDSPGIGSHTIKLRLGSGNSGSGLTFNGAGSARKMGGKFSSTIRIKEYAA